ncbi:MAG: TetR/AcrR family transcriptional regulator [Streptosporangiaceae bacterium]
MAQTLGRREAHKQATRQALQQAADRLFAEQGYGATTVRDIAEAAGVNERTFFRYFTGKEELIIEDALGWLPVLLDKLRDRPDDEDVGTALRRAMQDVGALLSGSPRPTPLWLFSDGPPGTRISRMPTGTLLRIEAELAAVIRERLERTIASSTGLGSTGLGSTGLGSTGGDGLADTDYLAEMLARITLAMIRSAMIRHAQLSRDPDRETVPTSVLVDQALSILVIPACRDLGPESGPTTGETL